MPDSTSRVTARTSSPDVTTRQFAEDVQYYLSLRPRQLPSQYLYDPLGSALFDAICHLPWYGITRAERALLATHRRAIFDAVKDVGSIVELGGGNGEKLATLIESGERGILAARHPATGSDPAKDGRYNVGRKPRHRIAIHLIDVSASALALSARVLSALGDVHIVTHQASYEDGLVQVASERYDDDRLRLTLFLGSNIGNFDPPAAAAFLTEVRASLRTGDAFLLGADLVKPERDLLLAYDDPLGITAAFNRNLLQRINRELAGNFDLEGFSHRAVWNEEASRVEMHLVSARRQQVKIPGVLELEFEAGETIWTESSYKYTPEGILQMLEQSGFQRVRQWVEPHAAFALTLTEAV